MSATTLSSNSGKMNIDQIKKNLAKRTFSVKFDLDNSDYKPLENIGIGAYGVVCSAIHKKTNDKVAIKKIPHIFEAETVTKRTYREIKILKHFKHDNIINIREILKPKEQRFQEIYVVFDLMESDLHRIIYTEQELTEEHIRYFLYQILRGLKYIHSANVIHRDLKPSNLLVNEDCHVRIGDFGMARGISQTPDEPCYYMTQYVATRWYRAPEILLSLVEYGTAVDMWSVGCIFAEMLGRKHLFPGKNYLSQIKLIVGVLGSPSEDVLKFCHNDLIRRIIKSLGHRQPVSWKTLFPKASKKAIDLLSKMLTINPEERITVEKALEHLYLSKYHDPDDEPICVPTFNFDFEKKELSKVELHDSIYKEIMEFHQPKTPTLSFNAVLRPAPKPEPSPQEQKINPDSDHFDLLQLLQQQESLKSDDTKVVAREVVKPRDDEVFKKPMPQRDSLVSVDTNALVPPQSVDIEMLSARSTDSRQEMDTVAKAEVKVEGNQQQQKQQKQTQQQGENKTISSDTKALVKQALLNSSQRRQRSESNSEDTESKPRAVTAAQRMKEREEKRRKKKEKANERLKKQKEKQNAVEKPFLSSEDKELLKRWACMQTKIAPAQNAGPSCTTQTQPVAVSLQGNSLTLTPISQPQPALQTGQVPTLQVQTAPRTGQVQGLQVQTAPQTGQVQGLQVQTAPQTGQVQGLQVQTAPQTGQVQLQQPACIAAVVTGSLPSQQPTTMPTSDGKPDLLADTPNQGQNSHLIHLANREQHSPPHPVQQSVSPISMALQQDTENLSHIDHVPALVQDTAQIPVNLNQIPPYLPASDLHPNINSNCMFQQPGLAPATGFSVPNVSVSSQTTLPSQVQQFINTSPPHAVMQDGQSQTQYPSHNHSPQMSYTHTGNSVPISTLNSDIPPSNSVVTSSALTSIDFDGLDFFKDMVQENNTPTSVQAAFEFEPYPDQLPEPRSPPKRHSLDNSCAYQPTQDFTANSSVLVHATNDCQYSQAQLESNSAAQDPSSFVQQQHSFQNPSIPFTSYNQGHSDTTPSFPVKTVNVHYSTKVVEGATSVCQGQSTSVSSRTPPALKITCNPLPSGQAQPDLIAMLSKQFSKSHVEDIFPPALSLTPKGTGGGYGVGADLDALMVDTQEHLESARIEQSPLSSSLLADWLDVRGNISLADLEALEREMELHSPMAVSYSDVGLHHS